VQDDHPGSLSQSRRRGGWRKLIQAARSVLVAEHSRADLPARQGNIHFAGEHCSINFQGFMKGGASEGVRAANEILADLKKA
jgi:monoamine oxidase